MVKCIQNKNKNILVQDENIKDQWRKYFDELYNREHGNVVGGTTIIPLDENGKLMRIQNSEVDATLK